DESDKVFNDGKLSQFYPVTGGILRSMPNKPADYIYLSVDGVENCKEAFDEIKQGNLKHCFIEMSACKGSCVNGPGVSNHHKAVLQCSLNINRFAGDGKYDVSSSLDFEKSIDFIGIKNQMPGEESIRHILAKIGKTKPEDELNCGSCGYNTCREKAIAVYLGKADLTMCMPYLKAKAESFSDNVINNTPNGIFIMDEDLRIQQINNAACTFFGVDTPNELIDTPIVDLLNPTDYLAAIASGIKLQKETKKHLDKFNLDVAETIVYDSEYHLLFSIMRDITVSETLNRERNELRGKTVEITDKVIEKQMRIVQEIASLLGETTAETKIALTQLKETLEN
ncbi:MAG: (Fe-S)-binding protein, partial [Oscillospiraceae bacterium]